MAITIDADSMTSDLTPAWASWRPHAAADGQGAWVVSSLPGRLLTRSQAQTAMALAEVEAAGAGGSQRAAGLRYELGIA